MKSAVSVASELAAKSAIVLIASLAVFSLGTLAQAEPRLTQVPVEGAGENDDSAGFVGALTAAQSDALSEEGLSQAQVIPRGASSTGDWVKVSAVGSDGHLMLLAMSPDGRILPSDEVAELSEALRLDAHQRVGAWDDRSRESLAKLAASDVVEVDLHAVYHMEIDRPSPLDLEEGDDTILSERHSQLAARWADWHRSRLSAQAAAAEVLRQELEYELQNSSVPAGEALVALDHEVPGLLHIRCTVELAEKFARLPSVAAIQLDYNYLPPPEASAAYSNVIMGFNDFRNDAPWYWNGGGAAIANSNNLDRIRVGHFEPSAAHPYGVPGIPPGYAAQNTIRPVQPVGGCFYDSDCGPCGLLPSSSADDCRCLDNVCISFHASSIRSMLASKNLTASPSFQEIGARGAHYLYDNKWPPSNGFSWFNSNATHIVSLSVIGPSAFDRDTAVRDLNIAVFNAAGNNGDCTTPGCHKTSCSSPNVTCVGNSSPTTGTMNPSSNWQNFAGLDREQPDVVAPGTSITCFGATGYYLTGAWVNCGSGTSYSAPIAASAAVLLHDMTKTSGSGAPYYPTFELYPEVTKAVAMAGATYNIADGPTSNPGLPDEYDGAGQVMASTMKEIYSNGRWSIRQFMNSDPAFINTLRSVYLTAGQRLRAYIVWSRCPSNTVSDLNSDYDLHILSPSSALIGGGYSYDQTYEVADVVASVSGNYTIQSYRWYQNSCNGSGSEIVALAYHIY